MFELSARAKDYIERTKAFIAKEIEPIEAELWAEVHELNHFIHNRICAMLL